MKLFVTPDNLFFNLSTFSISFCLVSFILLIELIFSLFTLVFDLLLLSSMDLFSLWDIDIKGINLSLLSADFSEAFFF